MLELLNRMRENPAAELPILLNSNDADVNGALAYFNVNRSVLQTQWNSLVPAPALAWNDNLAAAAAYHNSQMLATGLQSHQVPGEQDLGGRASMFAYNNWSYLGENIFAYATSPFQAHAAFAIDWGSTSTGIQNPPGHRDNIMDAGFRDVGIAFLDNPSQTNNVGPLLVTQDFGNRFGYGNAFLVGSVFNDANTNGYYDQGEGLAGVTLTVTGPGGSTSVGASIYGGYQVQLAPGTYTVTASGGGLSAPVTRNVTIGSTNVHANFIRGSQPYAEATLPFSDDFNRANSSFIGAYWTQRQGNFSVANNALLGLDNAASLATVNGLAIANVAVQADVTLSPGQAVGLVSRYQSNGSFYLGAIQADSTGANYTAYLFAYTPGSGFVQLGTSTVFAGGAGVLRFETVGASLKLFYGPNASQLMVVGYAFDSALSAGTTGLRSFRAAGIDNFSTTAVTLTTPTPPFSDAFTQVDGSQLSRNWSERQGNFSVVGNALRGNDTGISLATVNGLALADVSVQANVSLAGGQVAGLIARHQSDGSFYVGSIVADASGTTFTPYIFKYSPTAGFARLDVAAASIPASDGVLRFEAVGSSLKLFLGSSLLTYAYDGTLTAGSTGIRVFKNVVIDNFTTAGISLTSPASLPFTDAFTLADGSQLSRNWTERQGNFGVLAGAVRSNDAGVNLATLNGVAVTNTAVQANVTLAANQVAGLVARYQADGSYYVGSVVADGAGASFTPYIFKYTPATGFVRLDLAAPTVPAAAGVLRFEVVGTSLKLFLGSTLLTFAHDAAIVGAGTTGIRATRGATLDNFTTSVITPTAPTPPFTDTFTLADGSQLSRNWTERQGNFGIAGGAARASAPGISLATLNGVTLANAVVQADIAVGVGQTAALVARYQSNGDFYLASLYHTGAAFTVSLFRFRTGVGFTQLNSTATTLSSGTGTLRFELVGNSLRVYFGPSAGQLSLVASALDSSITSAGLTGIRASTNASVDNFAVQ